MVAGYLTLSSLETTILPSNYLLNNTQSMYSRYNNVKFSDLSGEGVIIIDSVSISGSSFILKIDYLYEGTVLTLINKLKNVNISLFSYTDEYITTLYGFDMCKIVSGGTSSWAVLFNQTQNASPGYMYGNVHVVDRANGTPGLLPMSSSNSALISNGFTTDINSALGRLTVNNTGKVRNLIRIEMVPLMEGVSSGTQTFDFNIVIEPSSLSNQLYKSSYVNAYGYSPCSMIAYLDSTNVTSFTLTVSRTTLSSPQRLLPSDIIITTLPSLYSVESTSFNDMYKNIVPQMTSDTTPAPFKIVSYPENPTTPAWYAFNVAQTQGWISNGKLEDQPTIEVDFGTERKRAFIIRIETLDLTPDQMNMNVYITAGYVEDGVNYLNQLVVADYIVGNSDGTSKTYEYFIEDTTTYSFYSFMITYYSTDDPITHTPGFKQISLFSNELEFQQIGGYNFGTLPGALLYDSNGSKGVVPPSEALPPTYLKQRGYFNSIKQNARSIDYSGRYDLLNVYDTPFTHYMTYNGPDTFNGLDENDCATVIQQYTMLYKSITNTDYSILFRLKPRSTTLVRGDVIPFELVAGSYSTSRISVTLSQNDEIMNFQNRTNSPIKIGIYIPIMIKDLVSGAPPKLCFYIELAPYPYKISAGMYNSPNTTSMVTNLYETFTTAPNYTTRVQIYAEPSGGDTQFYSIDSTYYLGCATIY